MNTAAISLRLRIFGLVCVPLVFIAALLGVWRYLEAQKTAQELFDKFLLTTAIAILKDVTVSQGDALAPHTRDLINNATGGEVFYHVTGPGGIYITGYAYPPVNTDKIKKSKNEHDYYEAVYRSEVVRVLRFSEQIEIDGFEGLTTVTVWQRLSERDHLAQRFAVQTFTVMAILLTTLALLIWFGIQRGLRPLTDLQDAISIRNVGDLRSIKRPVPPEIKGIVATLNSLLDQLRLSLDAHKVFISDAAHQLRNPAAAVQSMAEAVLKARSTADEEKRLEELVQAAKESGRVADQLLSLDRLQLKEEQNIFKIVDFNEIVKEACLESGRLILSGDLEFEICLATEPLLVKADSGIVGEAIKNLLHNAFTHGGKGLSTISIATYEKNGFAVSEVRDDGVGLKPEDSSIAFSRFGQLNSGPGSGLGLAITLSVADQHNGSVTINEVEKGTSILFALPIIKQASQSMI